MTRTKLSERILPNYSKGEELINSVTHALGIVMGVVALILCVLIASNNENTLGIVSGVVFGTSMILLYTCSTIYHALSPQLMAKKVFQVIDHCAIFVLIAGTYTPFSLCTLMQYDKATGWDIFLFIWAAAILGIVLNAIDLKKYQLFSMICYLSMGWCIVFKADLLPKLLGDTGLILLVLGGVIYTIGAILYGLGKHRKYMHSVFHVCVVIGSLLHFLCIVMYVM